MHLFCLPNQVNCNNNLSPSFPHIFPLSFVATHSKFSSSLNEKKEEMKERESEKDILVWTQSERKIDQLQPPSLLLIPFFQTHLLATFCTNPCIVLYILSSCKCTCKKGRESERIEILLQKEKQFHFSLFYLFAKPYPKRCYKQSHFKLYIPFSSLHFTPFHIQSFLIHTCIFYMPFIWTISSCYFCIKKFGWNWIKVQPFRHILLLSDWEPEIQEKAFKNFRSASIVINLILFK